MKNSYLILFITVLSINGIKAQNYPPFSDGEIVEHTYYTLSYNETHEQANWVYYILTSDLAFGTVDRTNDFRIDEDVSTGTATNADYLHSGYERGHMCPAEAMSFNTVAMSESFFYSNMSPQSGSLNRGKWKSLETKVRNWAKEKGEIHVVSGPIYQDNINIIGSNGVTVPGYYYKLIYCPQDEQGIAFVFANKRASKSLNKYITTIDWVEEVTGIEFYNSLPDSKESIFETRSDPSFWGLSGNVITYVFDNAPDDRCEAITKKGERCKRKKKEGSNYCWQHQK